MMKLAEFIAKVKLFKDIAVGYFSLYAYFTVFLIYLKIELPLFVTVSVFLACVILSIFDWIYIFPEQQKITWQRNPAFHDLKGDKK